MVSRYKKDGGFVQLVQLIESCEEVKRKSFLRMIESENLTWARAIKMKMLTMEKIFSWKPEDISQAVGVYPEDIILALMVEYKEPMTKYILPKYSQSQQERILESVEGRQPQAKEVERAKGQFISEVRKSILKGRVPIEKIDSQLHIQSGIEEELMQGKFQFEKPKPMKKGPVKKASSSTPTPSRPGQSSLERRVENAEELKAELDRLKEKVSVMAYQNHRLRRENKILQEQLEQKKKAS